MKNLAGQDRTANPFIVIIIVLVIDHYPVMVMGAMIIMTPAVVMVMVTAVVVFAAIVMVLIMIMIRVVVVSISPVVLPMSKFGVPVFISIRIRG